MTGSTGLIISAAQDLAGRTAVLRPGVGQDAVDERAPAGLARDGCQGVRGSRRRGAAGR